MCKVISRSASDRGAPRASHPPPAHFQSRRPCACRPIRFEFVDSQVQQRIVQFTVNLQRPVSIAELLNLSRIRGQVSFRPAHSQISVTLLTIEAQTDVLVLAPLAVSSTCSGLSLLPGPSFFVGSSASMMARTRAAIRVLKFGRRKVIVNQAPFFGALASETFRQRRKNIGAVTADLAFVYQAPVNRPCPAARRAAALPAARPPNCRHPPDRFRRTR